MTQNLFGVTATHSSQRRRERQSNSPQLEIRQPRESRFAPEPWMPSLGRRGLASPERRKTAKQAACPAQSLERIAWPQRRWPPNKRALRRLRPKKKPGPALDPVSGRKTRPDYLRPGLASLFPRTHSGWGRYRPEPVGEDDPMVPARLPLKAARKLGRASGVAKRTRLLPGSEIDETSISLKNEDNSLVKSRRRVCQAKSALFYEF
jgi:hypothetical protein